MRPLAIAIVAMSMSACALKRDDGALVRASWVGAPVAQLVAAWGEPTRRQATGAGTVDSERIVYSATRMVHMPGSVDARGMSAGNIPAMDVPMTCVTTFTVTQGVVSAWQAEGDDCRYAPVPTR